MLSFLSKHSTSPTARAPRRLASRELIEAANKAYHEKEAELYDVSHPEILWGEQHHWEWFLQTYIPESHPPLVVVDVGAGTGFVGSVLQRRLSANDRYIGVDLSPEMLEVLKRNLQSAPYSIEGQVAHSDALPFADNSCDIVTMNSVLHHFPDVESSLREAGRILKPGGWLVIMHEPNIRFSRSWFFRQVARASSVLSARIDSPSPMTRPKLDFSPIFAHVNHALLQQGLASAPLSQAEIQALVDCHSPTARGYFEPVGFDPLSWSNSSLPLWKVHYFETYNFLGKLDPTAVWWRRCLEKTFRLLVPARGSLFSIILQKPPAS